jgi:hypothetical protein
MYPVTPWGKVCAALTMLCSIVVIALPISVLGANFTQLWSEFKVAKQAAARIDLMWPNLQDLVETFANHELVLADLMRQIREHQAAITALIGDMRTDVVAARTRLAALKAGASANPALESDIADVASLLSKLRGALVNARHRWLELHTAAGVLSSTQSPELMHRLDLTYSEFDSLVKWSKEGVHVLSDLAAQRKECRQLLERVSAAAGAEV